jgi:hypothetical protein
MPTTPGRDADAALMLPFASLVCPGEWSSGYRRLTAPRIGCSDPVHKAAVEDSTGA